MRVTITSRAANGRINRSMLRSDGAYVFTPVADRDASGEIWAVWTIAGRNGERQLRWSRTRRGRFLPSQPLVTEMPVNTAPSLMADFFGSPLLVWAGFDGHDDEIFAATWRDGAWSKPQRIHAENDVPDILPDIDKTEHGHARVRWLRFNGFDGYDACYADFDGATWSATTVEPMLKASGDADAKSKIEGHSGETVVIAYGDSITQGYPYLTEPGMGREVGGYVPILSWIRNRFVEPTRVVNHGWGGEGTAQGVTRLSLVLNYEVNADRILIMEGTNDEWTGVSPHTTLFNLEAMIDLALNAGVEPILATLTPSTRDPEGDIRYVLNPGITALAQRRGIWLCDQYSSLARNWGRWSDDGLHPNVKGYAVMALTWHQSMPETLP